MQTQTQTQTQTHTHYIYRISGGGAHFDLIPPRSPISAARRLSLRWCVDFVRRQPNLACVK